jgi:hypothetical protein
MMAVKHVIRLWPENRIVACIEAVGTHNYFANSDWWFGDEGLIGSGNKIFPIEEESPDFTIRCTNLSCKNLFSGKSMANSRFNIPSSTQNLSRLSFASTQVILISS